MTLWGCRFVVPSSSFILLMQAAGKKIRHSMPYEACFIVVSCKCSSEAAQQSRGLGRNYGFAWRVCVRRALLVYVSWPDPFQAG
ncbi:hypothetical protein V8C26DRAFT_384377, partial [Trichoderma gracile]